MTTTDSPPKMLLAYLFRSCVTCYNAKPRKLLGETDTVRVNVDDEPPIFALFSGADSASAPGVSLISAYTKEQELEIAEEPIAFSGDRAFMVFVKEHEAPQWLRDARRTNKWPLASSSAFPTFFATNAEAEPPRTVSL